LARISVAIKVAGFITPIVDDDVQLPKSFYTEENLFMKRSILIISVVLIVVGFISARVGDSLSTITDGGVVQDSLLMPVGAVLFGLGFLALVVAVIWYLIDFIRGRLKKA
jgi:hypothetical protein